MNNVLKKVFMWMAAGLFLTFITGYIVSINPNMIAKIFTSKIYILLAIVEFILVIALSAGITKLNPTTAKIMFLIYSFVTGLTFSSIFIVYNLSSIMLVFLICSIVFAMFSIIGMVTKIDLTGFEIYLFMALLAIIICSIINIFLGNTMFDIIICSISILVFLGYTIYDVHRIEYLSDYIDEENLAIYGALQLYLDFINIFIDLLKLFGKSKD